VVACHLGELEAERARPGADQPPPGPHAVRLGDRVGTVEPLAERLDLRIEMRVERQLAGDEQGRDEDDARPPVRGETAGEVERVHRLLLPEQWHDNAAVADRHRPPRKPPQPPLQRTDIGPLHSRIWYGTLARIRFGSKSSSRLM
jgi:hypothetical protein